MNTYLYGSEKKPIMKKIVLLLLLAAPIVGMAQKKPSATSAADKGKKAAQQSTNVDMGNNDVYYAEIIAMHAGNAASIRIDIGLDYKAVVTNDDDAKVMETLLTRKYQSVAQALNAANSAGFEMAGSFEFETRGGKEVHIILEKEIIRERTNSSTQVQGSKEPRPGKKR